MQAEAEVSRAEFERLNPGQTVPPLVARAPQLRENESLLEAARAAVDEVDAQAIELQASVRQAEASLRQANVSLDRTKVKLPAETGAWRVASESADAVYIQAERWLDMIDAQHATKRLPGDEDATDDDSTQGEGDDGR